VRERERISAPTMSKPANISRLSSLRRGYIMGYRRARHKARAELRSMDAEVVALQHDFHELALELHRDRYDRALDEAIVQRAVDVDIVLH
jgi:hypothetical protein